MIDPLRELPAADPTDVYRRRDGIFATELLVAALCHLDLFTLLVSRGVMTLDALCEQLGLHRRPADVMMTLFAAMGFVEREGETFRASRVAREFLSADSPWNLEPYYTSLRDRPLCRSMLDVLRTGRPATWASEDEEWACLAATGFVDPRWLEVAAGRGAVTARKPA